jgi:hypothetical protein
MKNVSWKTTLCGIISSLGAVLTQLDNPTLNVIGQFLLPIGTLCTGYFAKDNNDDVYKR